MIRFFVSILAGIGGAALGFAIGVGIGQVLVDALRISCFEGACGYFVILIALIGGMIGLVVGILTALLWGRRRAAARQAAAAPTIEPALAGAPGAGSEASAATPAGGAGRTIGQLAGAIVVIAALAVGGTWLYAWMSDDTVAGPNEAAPQLYYEVRFPARTKLPDSARAVDVQLDTPKNQAWGDLFDDWKRTDDGRPVVAGFFDLYFKTSSRILSIGLPGGPTYVFMLKLPSAPDHMTDYSPWYPVDHVDEGTSDRPRKATDADNVQIRYRVVYAGRD